MLGTRSDWYSTVRDKHDFLLNPPSISVWLDGKETKSIVQETARETTALMQLTANDVGEIKSSSSRNPNLVFANAESYRVPVASGTQKVVLVTRSFNKSNYFVPLSAPGNC